MVEDVSTGGLKKFSYSKDTPKLSGSEKQEIREAYRRAAERKKKEKRKKIIVAVIISIIILIILGTIFLR